MTGEIVLFKKAGIFLLRNPTQSAILFLLLTMIFTLAFSGILLFQSTQGCREDTLRQIGATIHIGPNTSYQNSNGNTYTPITKDALDLILKTPHVMGYDASNSDVAGICLPICFNNVKNYTGVNPYRQKTISGAEESSLLRQNCVYLMGSNAISLVEQFRKHLSTIINGDFPSDTNKGVLISSELARANHLTVGDKMKLQFSETNRKQAIKTLKIVGIYSAKLKFEIASTNFMGSGVLASSPYNQVFADYSTACSVTGHNGDITFFDIYIDSPDNISYVADQVKTMKINWKQYQIDNYTQEFYQEYAGQLNNLIDKSKEIVVFSMIAGSILFLIVISFWNKNYINDMGILISLGERKSKIVLQKLVECFTIAVPAIALSIFVGYFTVCALSVPLTPKYVSSNAANSVASYYTGEDDVRQILTVVINKVSILQIAVFGFALVLISTVIPMYLSMRYNARKIFETAE